MSNDIQGYFATQTFSTQYVNSDKIRLIGIGASDFSPPAEADHGDLADRVTPRLKAMEGALDALRARFGDDTIGRGLSLRLPQRPSAAPATSRRPAGEEDPDA